MTNYDPLWTAEEALAATIEESSRLGIDLINAPDSPVSQWHAHHVVAAYEAQHAEGDKFALMAALAECACASLPLPEWVAKAYLSAFRAVVGARSKSWDDVFGRPYPKGTNLAALRKKRIVKLRVWSRAREILQRERHTPIDEAFFERLGKEFNIGKTLASEYYYAAKNQFVKKKTAP